MQYYSHLTAEFKVAASSKTVEKMDVRLIFSAILLIDTWVAEIFSSMYTNQRHSLSVSGKHKLYGIIVTQQIETSLKIN